MTGGGPVLVDRSGRLRMAFTGDGAKTALGGLVTSDVAALVRGQGQRSAALTPKGRVIALLRVFDRGTDVLVDADAAAAAGFVSMIRKYVNPRLAKYTDLTTTTTCLGVYGEGAATVVARALAADGAALAALVPQGGAWFGEQDQGVYVVRSTDLTPAGYDLIGAPERLGQLRRALVDAGCSMATPEAVTIARVEAGIPEWGRDLDAETIPQEALLDELGAISFAKGCYTGQEVVARIHFRGHVNRQLRWLAASEPMSSGARVLDLEGKEVGDVRTSVHSPSRGPIAIAMVRREVEPGSEVRVVGESGEIIARASRITAPA